MNLEVHGIQSRAKKQKYDRERQWPFGPAGVGVMDCFNRDLESRPVLPQWVRLCYTIFRIREHPLWGSFFPGPTSSGERQVGQQ